ncbi:hypothetical protein SAY87_008192 [Trapa incisa]|uniref:Uncharacterized protein n=1 Tax=Trapa incisa TaxID=236973 RepID=A0AAN7QJ45_9MYRT|nr:hypothetical protein SAY87_008192 [Trapa incisa]
MLSAYLWLSGSYPLGFFFVLYAMGWSLLFLLQLENGELKTDLIEPKKRETDPILLSFYGYAIHLEKAKVGFWLVVPGELSCWLALKLLWGGERSRLLSFIPSSVLKSSPLNFENSVPLVPFIRSDFLLT